MFEIIIKFKIIILCGLLTAFIPSKTVAKQDQDITCIAIAISWSGSFEETVNIQRTPVPESFKQHHETTDVCTKWSFISESLLDWHLEYGSEESLSKAQKYLYKDKISFDSKSKNWLSNLQEANSKLRATLSDDRPDNGGLYNIVSNTDDVLHLFWLDAAEVFNSSKLLTIADKSIDAFSKRLNAVEEITEGLSIDQLSSTYFVRQNLRYSLARAKARSAMLHHYLGHEDRLNDIFKYLNQAFDVGLEFYIEDIESGRILSCEGYQDIEDIDTEIGLTCGRVEQNGSYLLYDEALRYYGLVYRAEILKTNENSASDDKEINQSALEQAKWNYLTALYTSQAHTKLDDIGNIQDTVNYTTQQNALIALWLLPQTQPCLFYRDGESNNEQLIFDHLEQLSDALDMISMEEWPTLWKKVAEQYLIIDACNIAIIKERDETESKNSIFHRQTVKAKLQVLKNIYSKALPTKD